MGSLILLNSRAGTLYSGGIVDPAGIVERAFAAAGRDAEVALIDPKELDRELERAHGSSHDTVIVGGGDGTFSHALAKLADSGKTLGLLPLGTMNLLGRDLGYPPGDLEVMAGALANGEVSRIDLATINGRPFHTLAGLGYFSRVARNRERTRLNVPLGRLISVMLSIWRSVTQTGRISMDITVDGKEMHAHAYAALVTSNRIGNDWRRPHLDEGLLELHLMRQTHLAGRAKAGLELISGRWREGDTIESFVGREIDIRMSRPRVWLAVDGELWRESTPLHFRIEKMTIPMLMPRSD